MMLGMVACVLGEAGMGLMAGGGRMPEAAEP